MNFFLEITNMETLDTYLPKTLVALVYDYALASLWKPLLPPYYRILSWTQDWKTCLNQCKTFTCHDTGIFYRLVLYEEYANMFDFDDINEVDAYIRKRFHIVPQLDLLFSVKT